MATVLCGKVDAIILTGGIAHNNETVRKLIRRVSYIASVAVYPGEDEMKALAFNGLLALDGRISIRTYK
jgi:butyrate kinase